MIIPTGTGKKLIDATLVIEVTTTAALAHGMGVAGNEQVLRTLDFNVQRNGQHERVEIPAVSGQAGKASLREAACELVFSILGATEGSLSMDGVRLALKGGKNDSGEKQYSLAEVRRQREILPILDLFGALDAGTAIPGCGQFSDIMPYCEELVEAGILPRHIHFSDASGEVQTEEIYPGMAPIPLHMVRTTIQNFRHDMRMTPVSRMIGDGAQQRLLEQKAEANHAAKAAGKAVKKEDRREANESMPYTIQGVAAGTPLLWTIRLSNATEAALGLLLASVARWSQKGGHLGGKRSVGLGTTSARIRGYYATESRTGALYASGRRHDPGLILGSSCPEIELFRAHVLAHKEEALAVLSEVVR